MSLASFAFGTRLVFCTCATAFLYPFLVKEDVIYENLHKL